MRCSYPSGANLNLFCAADGCVLQVAGFAVSLAGLYMYREYKSDPKRAVELFLSAVPCLVCSSGGDNDNRNTSSGGGGGARTTEGGSLPARSPRHLQQASSVAPGPHAGEEAECELPLLSTTATAVEQGEEV
jgi:hypothetical protein